jgi:hypothetical protein
MSNQNFEYCFLEQKTREEKGFLKTKIYARDVAVIDAQVIAETPEIDITERYVEFHHATEALVKSLMRDGWEPMSFDEHGRSRHFRRPIAHASSSESSLSKQPMDLLQQLVNLRDAGILTQSEFEAKKVEIMKRL